jgi:hypothetical protein
MVAKTLPISIPELRDTRQLGRLKLSLPQVDTDWNHGRGEVRCKGRECGVPRDEGSVNLVLLQAAVALLCNSSFWETIRALLLHDYTSSRGMTHTRTCEF